MKNEKLLCDGITGTRVIYSINQHSHDANCHLLVNKTFFACQNTNGSYDRGHKQPNQHKMKKLQGNNVVQPSGHPG